MANLKDYIVWRGDVDMAYDKFNEADGAVLARLAYLPFEGTALEPQYLPQKIIDARINDISALQKDKELLRLAKESRRFGDIGVCAYVNKTDISEQTQFAAVTFRLSDELYYVAFRGTEDTLVGWKEDFNMSFTFPVPSQSLAVSYYENVADCFKNARFILGGHSKGGNLAVCAAAFCRSELQDRVISVYNYDGPGFDGAVISTAGYKSICGRIHTFLPQSSIVGMLLEHEEKYAVIHSMQTGLWQHDIYSWEIVKNHFVYLDSVTNSSRIIDRTIKDWVASVTPEHREQLVDIVYDIMTDTNIQTFKELSEHRFASAKAILKATRRLDPDTRRTVTEAFAVLLKSARKNLPEILKKNKNVQ